MRDRDEHEIYPNAPLRYVACEVRFPHSPALVTEAGLSALHATLAGDLPIAEPGTEATVLVGPQGPLPGGSETRTIRFLSRDRRQAVFVTSSQVLIETTDYTRYEDFRRRIERAIGAVATAAGTLAGLLRIGLRYIDEVRVDQEMLNPRDWLDYIDGRLLSPADLVADTAAPEAIQGLLRYAFDDSVSVVMRYGALRGRTVGDAPLRPRKATPDGPYFLIDVDSFWSPSPERLPEFDAEALLAISDRLHRPIREVFEASITERLRDEVLRRGTDGD